MRISRVISNASVAAVLLLIGYGCIKEGLYKGDIWPFFLFLVGGSGCFSFVWLVFSAAKVQYCV
jgi:membrane-bound ClpP family serine protease